MRSTLLIFLAVALAFVVGRLPSSKSDRLQTREIRTYLPYSFPIDPAKIHTLPEMNIIRSLGRTLIEWDDDKELSGGLATGWKVTSPRTYRLTLKPSARWSDGTPLTCIEAKQSVERTLKLSNSKARTLGRILSSISCPSASEIEFHLKLEALKSDLPEKLTDFAFAIFKTNAQGLLDLSVTSGAFYLSNQSNQSSLYLEQNPHGEPTYPRTAQRLVIRYLPIDQDPQKLLLNSWTNLIETSSLSTQKLEDQYRPQEFRFWKTPWDKVFYLQLSKKSTTPQHRALLSFLRQQGLTDHLTQGFFGFQKTLQVFPTGYELYDPNWHCSKPISSSSRSFQNLSLKILYSPARVPALIKTRIQSFLKTITGIEPQFKAVALDQVHQERIQGDFDIYVGMLGLSTPDDDEATAYFFESDTPIAYREDPKFQKLLAQAHLEPDLLQRANELKELLKDSVCEGYLLPLFHTRTIAIARAEIDFGSLPVSDPFIRLSRVKFVESHANHQNEVWDE